MYIVTKFDKDTKGHHRVGENTLFDTAKDAKDFGKEYACYTKGGYRVTPTYFDVRDAFTLKVVTKGVSK